MNTFMIGFLSVSVSALWMAGIVVLLEKLLKNHLSFRFATGSGCFVNFSMGGNENGENGKSGPGCYAGGGHGPAG